MMPSAFMAARVLGARADLAMAIQAPFSVFGVWLVWKAYRSDADHRLKAAVLMTATFVASPQAFNYDLIPAAAGAIVLWRRDGGAISRGLCLTLWALPVFMIAAQAVHIVIAPLVLAGAGWKLVQLTKDKPSRPANASITGEVASNT
jgi:membrane protein implicated in regulation of membrane protease activity